MGHGPPKYLPLATKVLNSNMKSAFSYPIAKIHAANLIALTYCLTTSLYFLMDIIVQLVLVNSPDLSVEI